MSDAFLESYRCPDSFAAFTVTRSQSVQAGFFRFGEDAFCYGTTTCDTAGAAARYGLYDALADVAIEGRSIRVPFDPSDIIENLRRERYHSNSLNGDSTIPGLTTLLHGYRLLRPALPFALRRYLQRMYLRGWDQRSFPSWPVDRTVECILERLFALVLQAHGADRIPFIWFWPEGAPSCAILTHDVEARRGRNFCSQLMDLDDAVGIKASFQLVPEQRYSLPPRFLDSFRERGFEINVHDMNHDGQLFLNREVFLQRAEAINRHGRALGAIGFRSGGLYRNPEWFDALDFSYDMSIPNVAHLDPQRGGCCTVLPFFIGDVLELPLTTTQDYSLFHILNDYSIELWKRQIALITEKHGLVSFLVHPDYVIEKRARATYRALLDYLAQLRADGRLWIALPGEVDKWWRERRQMTVVGDGRSWRIEGKGKERARLAFASLVDGQLAFTVEQQT